MLLIKGKYLKITIKISLKIMNKYIFELGMVLNYKTFNLFAIA